MNFNEFMNGLGQGTVSALPSFGLGIGSSLFGIGQQKKMLDYQIKKQQEYDQFTNENRMAQMLIGARRAGISAATLSGQMSPASGQVSMPSVSAPTYSDPSQSLASIAQSQLSSEDAKQRKIENIYKNAEMKLKLRKMGSDADIAQYEAQVKKETVADSINLIRVGVDQAKASLNLTRKQSLQIDNAISKLEAETYAITVNNEYIKRLKDKELQDLASRIRVQVADARYKEAVASLSEAGIYVSADWLTNLVAVAHAGKGSELMSTISKMLGDLLAGAPDAIGNILSGLVDGLSAPIGNGVDKVLKFLHVK